MGLLHSFVVTFASNSSILQDANEWRVVSLHTEIVHVCVRVLFSLLTFAYLFVCLFAQNSFSSVCEMPIYRTIPFITDMATIGIYQCFECECWHLFFFYWSQNLFTILLHFSSLAQFRHIVCLKIVFVKEWQCAWIFFFFNCLLNRLIASFW